MRYAPETIARMRAAKLGRKHSPEHNAAIREGLLKAWAKRNPLRFRELPAHLKKLKMKLYHGGIRGEELRKILEEQLT